MENAVTDPVLGPCMVIPMRRQRAQLSVLMMAAVALGSLVILGYALFVPGSNVDPKLTVGGFLGLFGWLALPKQISAATSPYYAIVGPKGFGPFGRDAILWKDVIGLQPRTYHGQVVALGVVLNRPVKRSFGAQLDTLFGLLNFMSPANVFFLPRALTAIPIDQVAALFLSHLQAYRNEPV